MVILSVPSLLFMLGNDIYCKLLVYELYIKEGKGPIKALKDQKIPDIFGYEKLIKFTVMMGEIRKFWLEPTFIENVN